MARIVLRPATMADAERVFGWRNLPDMVRTSSSQRPVPREEHMRWFARAAAGEGMVYRIVELDGVPCGAARVDVDENLDGEREGVISVYLVPDHMGRGAGEGVIRAISAAAFAERPALAGIVADVREENAPARTVFLRAGYVEEAPGLAGHRRYRLLRPAEGGR